MKDIDLDVNELGLLKNPHNAVRFAVYLNDGNRVGPVLESVIAQNGRTAITYAKEIIKGRFPEGEDAILQLPESDYSDLISYIQIIGEPWKEGEELFKNSDFLALHYSISCLNLSPFPAGEEVIMKSPIQGNRYCLKVLRDRDLRYEEEMLKVSPTVDEFTFQYIIDYIKYFDIPLFSGFTMDLVKANTFRASVITFCLRSKIADETILFGAIESDIQGDLIYRYLLECFSDKSPEFLSKVKEKTLKKTSKDSLMLLRLALLEHPPARWPEAEPYIYRTPSTRSAYLAYLSSGKAN